MCRDGIWPIGHVASESQQNSCYNVECVAILGQVLAHTKAAMYSLKRFSSHDDVPGHGAADAPPADAAGQNDLAMVPQTSVALRTRADRALSFEPEELHLLRGIPMNSLLRFGASVLARSEGSALSYKLSRDADELE